MFKLSNPLYISLFCFCLLLAACSRTPVPNANETGLSEEVASDLKDLSLQSSGYLINMFKNPTGLASLSIMQGQNLPHPVANLAAQAGLSQEAGECTFNVSNEEDKDKDDIPLDANFTLSCEENKNDTISRLNISIHVQDKNDNDPHSGYLIEVLDFSLLEEKDGETSSLKLTQTFDLDVLADSYAIDHVLSLSTTDPEGSGRFSEDQTVQYIPDDLAEPFTAGTLIYEGKSSLSDDSTTFALSSKTAPSLHYNEACSSEFDSGSIRYEDTLGNTASIQFNACNDISLSYNGSPASE